MDQHPNAGLTPRGRETPVSRAAGGERARDVARQMGAGRQTASKRPARARRGGPMSDRSSRPRRLARSTPPEAEERVVAARRELTLAPLGLAAETGVPARTCARIVARRGMPRLADVDCVTGEARCRGPVTTVRHGRWRPGELVHVDVKKVACIPDGGGRRALGRGCGSAPGASRSCLHVAVDDRGGVAHAEPLPDERGGPVRRPCPAACASSRGWAWAAGRVVTDDGPGRRGGGGLDDLLGSEGIKHKYTRPFSPRRNGEAERMNRTVAQERRCARAHAGEAERADALPAYLEHYNWNRPHSACGGMPPMSRIPDVNNLLAHNS